MFQGYFLKRCSWDILSYSGMANVIPGITLGTKISWNFFGYSWIRKDILGIFHNWSDLILVISVIDSIRPYLSKGSVF